MAASVREDLLAAGLAVFDRDGFDGATVAAIRTRARASNGSFYHFFASIGALFLKTLQRYYAEILAVVAPGLSAREGIDRLIRTHLCWVVECRREARCLFESAYLSGRDRSDPRLQADQLVTCAIRALATDGTSRCVQGSGRWRTASRLGRSLRPQYAENRIS